MVRAVWHLDGFGKIVLVQATLRESTTRLFNWFHSGRMDIGIGGLNPNHKAQEKHESRKSSPYVSTQWRSSREGSLTFWLWFTFAGILLTRSCLDSGMGVVLLNHVPGWWHIVISCGTWVMGIQPWKNRLQ